VNLGTCADMTHACICVWPVQVVRQQQIHQRLQNILGDMVARERGGEIVDKALLRSITQVGGRQGGCRYGLICGELPLPGAAASQPHSFRKSGTAAAAVSHVGKTHNRMAQAAALCPAQHPCSCSSRRTVITANCG
jgi:hypothetical protein